MIKKAAILLAGLLSAAFILPLVAMAANAFIVNQGGTGWQAFTANTVLLGNGTSRLGTTTAGTNGQVLSLKNGIPSWVSTTSASVTGTWPIIVTGSNITFGGLSTTTPWTEGGLAAVGANQNLLYSVATSTLSGSGVISVTTGAFTLGSNPISVSCSTCGVGSVTSITGGTGLNGGTITSAGTLSLKSYLATSTADTANQLAVFTSTNATPATFGGFANFTFNSTTNTFVVINASTTNITASQSLFAADSAATIRRVTGIHALSFTLASSTVWQGTSSAATQFGDGGTIYAPFTGASETLQCGTNAGTLGVNIQDGGGTNKYLNASTTANINTFVLAFTKGDALKITGGNPVTSPTSTPCTLISHEN